MRTRFDLNRVTPVLASALVAAVVVLGSIVAPHKVAASPVGGLPNCATNYLSTWDWPSLVRATGLSDFNDSTSSYLITGAVPGEDHTQTNHEYLFIANAGHRILLDVQSGHNVVRTDNNVLTRVTLTDMPNSVANYKINNGASPQFQAAISGSYTAATPYDATHTLLDATQTDCTDVAHNADYGPGWTYDKLNTTQAHGVGAGTTCSNTDIGCWIAKGYQGVENTLTSIAQATMAVVAGFFEPDTAQLQTNYNNLKTNITNHLGFLTYPTTMLQDLINALTSTTGTWCNDTSCKINAGNFYGSNYTIDLGAVQAHWPTLYTIITSMLRAFLVFELVLMIRKAYIRFVTH